MVNEASPITTSHADAQLSPHFWLSELIASQEGTRKGLANIPGVDALANLRRVAAHLEDVRALLGGRPILVSSGYRSREVNRAVGGASDSAHILGLAADFTCPHFGSPLKICRAIDGAGIGFDQLIDEGTWVHFGLAKPGATPRREVLTAHFGPGRTIYTRGLRP